MKKFTFNSGCTFDVDGQRLKVLRAEGTRLIVERQDGSAKIEELDALLEMYLQRRLKIIDEAMSDRVIPPFLEHAKSRG